MEARKQPTHVPNFWQSFEWRELYKKKKMKRRKCWCTENEPKSFSHIKAFICCKKNGIAADHVIESKVVILPFWIERF